MEKCLLRLMVGFSVLLCGEVQAIAEGLDQRMLEQMAIEIRKKNVDVSEHLLARDRTVIRAAYPEIKEKLTNKGFTNGEVNQAIASGWKQMRLEQTSTVIFNEQMFGLMVSKLGMLRIESQPRDAAIEIDATRQDQRTNTTTWLAPGTYHIVLTKPGYIPVEDDRTIVEGKNPPLRKILRSR